MQRVEGVTTMILTVIIGAKHYIIGWDNVWVGVTHQAEVAEATIILKPFQSLISLSQDQESTLDSQNCSLARISFQSASYVSVEHLQATCLWIFIKMQLYSM